MISAIMKAAAGAAAHDRRFPRAWMGESYDFSFSGLKTAVVNHVRKHPDARTADVAASFQEAVVQEKLRPAGQPSIEPKSMEPGRDLEYIATFEVFPEIEVSEMKGFDVECTVTAYRPR